MTHHQVLVSIITATTAASTLATAQETEYPNWFLQAGAGIDTPIMEGFQFNQTHVGATYNLGIGGWFTPDLGFRFSGYYNHYIENGVDHKEALKKVANDRHISKKEVYDKIKK